MIRDTAKEDDDFVNTIMQALDRVEQERNMLVEYSGKLKIELDKLRMYLQKARSAERDRCALICAGIAFKCDADDFALNIINAAVDAIQSRYIQEEVEW